MLLINFPFLLIAAAVSSQDDSTAKMIGDNDLEAVITVSELIIGKGLGNIAVK
jgi:hypothetical protein